MMVEFGVGFSLYSHGPDGFDKLETYGNGNAGGEGITEADARKILKRTLEFLEEQIGAHRGKSK
jgi:hypothetical protein